MHISVEDAKHQIFGRESEGNQLGFGVNRGEAWCSEAVNLDVEDVSSDQT